MRTMYVSAIIELYICFCLQCRKYVFPNQINLFLHIIIVCSYCYHRILFWQDDDELSMSSVGTECIMTAKPKLIAITLQPVA